MTFVNLDHAGAAVADAKYIDAVAAMLKETAHYANPHSSQAATERVNDVRLQLLKHVYDNDAEAMRRMTVLWCQSATDALRIVAENHDFGTHG